MSDETVRAYERELTRQGVDPKAIGARLLGVESGRFIALVHSDSMVEEAPVEGATKATLETRPAIGRDYDVVLVWCVPVATLMDVVELTARLRRTHHSVYVWDSTQRRSVGRGWNDEQLSDGWSPRGYGHA